MGQIVGLTELLSLDTPNDLGKQEEIYFYY